MAQYTTKELRKVLFDEIDLLREGKVSPVRSNAIARLSSSIIESAKLEFAAAQAKINGQPLVEIAL